MAGPTRSYVAGNFHMTLDGVKLGFLRRVSGGSMTAQVVNEAVGPDYFIHKHIGAPKYEDFVVDIGLGLAKPIYDWIAASWKGNYQRKDGSIAAADFNNEVKSQREFKQALVTETTIPAMDGAAKEPAYLTVKFAPEYARNAKASGKVDGGAYSKGTQKMFLPSNFRLELDGLDCTRVSKIDSFTVKQSTSEDPIGEVRDMAREPGKLEFPNLRVTLSQVSAQTWYEWFESFVVKGENDETKEKSGKLVFLSANRQKELASVKLFNCGIFKLTESDGAAHADQIKRVTAELYCERMEFVPPATEAK